MTIRGRRDIDIWLNVAGWCLWARIFPMVVRLSSRWLYHRHRDKQEMARMQFITIISTPDRRPVRTHDHVVIDNQIPGGSKQLTY